MATPSGILKLIERFNRNRDAYLSGAYNETQLRREFVDPFFEVLGWDIFNKLGYAEAYKDVIHEDAIKIGGYTKAPDYCFRIGGTRRFFVEAKKPSIDIRGDIGPAFQLRRYAWSAKLPLSILTDFEEFAVYDCRVKPVKTDKASTARILYLTYDNYPEKWDDITTVFSRDAILKGSFDKYVETTKGKKGTAAVDDAFLKEIESWRDRLAHNIALRNLSLSQRDLNFTVQAVIDRIIFLRICEDRGIEEYGRLLALLNGTSVYARLFELFQRADERYNSGLFHFRDEKDRHESPDLLTPGLTLDDKQLKEIIRNLYYPDSAYEFSVLPADILGQVYEQFLGKVIRLTAGHRAVVEDKPEVKKAGGIYYTPTYIVDYIVENTVGKLLEGKTPKQVSKLRILDLACGSGSFLIGAYQYLLDWHRDRYVEEGADKHTKVLYQGPGGEWRLTTAERKRVLLNNIYGVDIDPQAVEVTKLSLLLKVLEGESDETISKQLKLFHERALPDLSDNIKCGNSIIGPGYYDDVQIPLIDVEERLRVNPFGWDSEFNKVMGSGGFDVVLGNPPYGALLSNDEIAYLLSNYNYQDYQLDTYMLFIEQGFSLTKPNGLLGMIIPNTWLLNLETKKFRKYLFNETKIENIVHYRRKVFRKQTVDTEIVIFQRTIPDNDHVIAITVVGKDEKIDSYSILQSRWKNNNGKPANILERPEVQPLADRLRSLPTLDSVCTITQGAKPFQVGKGKPPQTRKTVNEKPFVSVEKENESFRPLLRGSLIQRYQILWNDNYWISFGDWLAEPRYSANYDAPAKIVIRQTGDSLVAALDCNQFVVRDNLYTIIQREEGLDLGFIIGVLNSRLLNWYFQIVLNPEKGEALAQVKRGHLAQLPIKVPDIDNDTEIRTQDMIIASVGMMLELKKRMSSKSSPDETTTLQREIDVIDRKIDQLVFELYGLTDDEIQIVEQ